MDKLIDSIANMKRIDLYDGKVKTFSSIKGHEAVSIVLIKPGKYDLGKASCDGTITVIEGTVFINGLMIEESRKIPIRKGEDTKITTEDFAVYLMKTTKYRR